jgi:hypothetical protein
MEFVGHQDLMTWASTLWPVLFGAAGGYAFSRYIGCRTGGCRLTSNLWISTLYGALIGALMLR